MVDNINKELFFKLVRNFKIIIPGQEVKHGNFPHIEIDGKTYVIESNKKYLKGRLYNFIKGNNEKSKNGVIDTSINKTIKEFINSANKINNK
jgi:hypothetical protein